LIILTANSDNVVRQWFAVLSSRSRYNENTMVFSKSIRELVAREKTSLIPRFVRYACEVVQQRGISAPTLFTAPVNMQVIERMRSEINRGVLPRICDMADEFAIAQLLLSYFAEMPEPLLTNDLYQDFYSYHRSISALKLNSGNVDDQACREDACSKLKAITAKLPLENSVTLYYLIKLLHLWEDVTGEKKVVLPLLQQIIMRPCENQSNQNQLSMASDVTETITYQIYTMIDELDIPKDVEAKENYEKCKFPEVSFKPNIVPVTVFSPEVKREIIDSVNNVQLLTDLESFDSSRSTSFPIRRAIIPRTKGSGGAEGSSAGRSTSSDGDNSASGNGQGDNSEEQSSSSSSHHTFLHLFSRKKKDNTQSGRLSSSSTSNSNSNSTSMNTSTTFSGSAPITPPLMDSTPPMGTSPVSIPPPPIVESTMTSPLSSIPASLPPQAIIPVNSVPNQNAWQIELPPFNNLPSMPMSTSSTTSLPLSVLPREVPVETNEQFMDPNEVSAFLADIPTQQATTVQNLPPIAFNPSIPPMPMSPPGTTTQR